MSILKTQYQQHLKACQELAAKIVEQDIPLFVRERIKWNEGNKFYLKRSIALKYNGQSYNSDCITIVENGRPFYGETFEDFLIPANEVEYVNIPTTS